MKIIKSFMLLLTILVSIYSCSKYPKPKKEKVTTLDYHELNGPVKSLVYREFYLVPQENGPAQKVYPYGYSKDTYNEAGYIIEMLSYDCNDSLSRQHTYRYDDRNKTVEATIIDPEGVSRTLYFYDENAYLVQLKNYKEDGSLDFNTLYKNDSLGREVESKHYDADSILERRTITVYDDKGRMIKSEDYDFDNKLVNSVYYTYDDPSHTMDRVSTSELRRVKSISMMNMGM